MNLTPNLNPNLTPNSLEHQYSIQEVELISNEELLVFDLKFAPKALFEKMGGKASTLAKLLKLSFPVPPGISVLSPKLNLQHWDFIREWAKVEQIYPVAVRSSAQGEDGQEVSYAGQFKTYLNVLTESDLVTALQKCFDSAELASSKSYAAHFKLDAIPMRVLVQKMIDPLFSGVYFSHDPRNQRSGWLIEAVEGLGEKLVSAQVNPYRFIQSQNSENESEESVENTLIDNSKWKNTYIKLISEWAQKAELALGYKIDMEWAIDKNNQFWILQVRPITTQSSNLNSKETLKDELARLLKNFDTATIWDGHSFAEISGVTSEFTFNLWQKSFLPGHAFDQALRLLGYTGLPEKNNAPKLLDRVFGRSYLNLKNIEPIYFGDSPYKVVPNPRPHLEFDFKKLNLYLILKAPIGILKMLNVAWKIQTQRNELSRKAQECLHDDKYDHLSSLELYTLSINRSPENQLEYLKKILNDFTTKYLLGSYLITLLIESTVQGLLAILTKDLGSEKAMEELQHFLGENLSTITTEMSQHLIQSHHSKENWDSFNTRFGHRGLGELELNNPRWLETNANFKQKSNQTQIQTQSKENKSVPLEARLDLLLKKISPIRRIVFQQEIKELQNMLKIREDIKMHIMKPYADIRWSLLAFAQSHTATFKNPNDIFWLNLDEIMELSNSKNNIQNEIELNKWKKLIQYREERARLFKSVELPLSFSALQLKDILTPKSNSATQLQGVSLSPGLAYGIIHKVENPELEDFENWPENIILVAEATDPGWTPLFEKSKAIIVARGGVLSHCAIVAREMGLPAVGEICGAISIFKEGEYVWVDGINGTVKRTC